MDDIGMGIAEAAINGFRLGKQIQQEEIINSWKEYAAELEKKLDRLQYTLENTKVALDQESYLRKRAQELLTNACKERDNLERKIVEIEDRAAHDCLRGQSLLAIARKERDEIEKKLIEKEKRFDAVICQYKKHGELSEAKLQELEHSLRTSSAKAAGLEGVLRMLKAEISAIDDPSRFNSLRTDVMLQEMGKYWDE